MSELFFRGIWRELGENIVENVMECSLHVHVKCTSYLNTCKVNTFINVCELQEEDAQTGEVVGTCAAPVTVKTRQCIRK